MIHFSCDSHINMPPPPPTNVVCTKASAVYINVLSTCFTLKLRLPLGFKVIYSPNTIPIFFKTSISSWISNLSSKLNRYSILKHDKVVWIFLKSTLCDSHKVIYGFLFIFQYRMHQVLQPEDEPWHMTRDPLNMARIFNKDNCWIQLW